MGNAATQHECWVECDNDDAIDVDVSAPQIDRVLDELTQFRILGTEETSVEEDLKRQQLHRQLTAAVMDDNAVALIELFSEQIAVSEMHKALALASGCGSINVVRELVGMGLSVNARDHVSGYSPLHMAACGGYIDICDILLDALADANCQLKGITPVCLAQKTGNTEIKELMEKHLAALAPEGHESGETAANKRNQVLPRISAVLTEIVMKSDLHEDSRLKMRLSWFPPQSSVATSRTPPQTPLRRIQTQENLSWTTRQEV
eukprot:TRINITY_DN4257_c0_g1_i4.p1 TRINITY_DN4257_c0_g1~~TRINITY_DN4257_c0_g1_i4.p1  ORF type:complete len:262 (+),score=57.98 TRINITY_DN4257_c0_g1_i4:36-821(+)